MSDGPRLVPPAVAIPAFESTGVLPPFLGSPVNPGAQSPYRVSLVEVINRFAGTVERRTILAGLLSYRSALHAAGFSVGFQWLDGSFMEQIEVLEALPPGDVDMVTFCTPPAGRMAPNVVTLFDPKYTKPTYRCDAYVVNLSLHQERIVRGTAYWYGLFSHRRDRQWKGMLEVDLAPVEDAAAAMALSQVGVTP